MSDDLKALRTTVLLLQDWLDDGFLGWLHDDSECVELIREAPKNLGSLESQNQALQEALRGLLHALGAHTVTLGAVIDHMTQHECFCQQADALYRADAESGDALHVAVNHAQAALSPTQETDPE